MARTLKVTVIKSYGAARIVSERDQIVKVELKEYNSSTGIDIRTWYKVSDERAKEMSAEEKAQMDAKGYLPGKGIFLRMDIAAWLLSKKAPDIIKDEDFLKAYKAAKEAATSDKAEKDGKATEKATALAKKEKELADKLAEVKAMEARLAKLLSAAEGKAAPAEAAGDDLEEVALPEDSLMGPTSKPKGRRSR